MLPPSGAPEWRKIEDEGLGLGDMSTAIELFLAPTGAATKSSFASGRMVCVAVLGIRTPANVVRRDEAGRETSMICTCAPRGSQDRLMTSGFEQQNPGTGVALDGGFHTLTIEPALSRRRIVHDLTAVMCVSTDPCKRCATAGSTRRNSEVAGAITSCGEAARQMASAAATSLA